jgi:hypothetical protein
MSRTMMVALTLAALAGCGQGDRRDVATADSLSRDLQLAPVDTTATLNDRPESTSTPAQGARTPTRPSRSAATRPRTPAASSAAPAAVATPRPAAPAASLAAGSRLTASTTTDVSSNKNQVGDTVSATLASDVKDNAGRVVIPAGSEVTLAVTAIKPSENKSDKTGTLTLKPTSVNINGQSYPLSAKIDSVGTHLQGRKTGAGDIAKPAAGVAIGAVVGRVLGGSTKGAVIGGVLGGAVGAQRAVETKDRDVVLPAGTTVVLILDQPFKPQS